MPLHELVSVGRTRGKATLLFSCFVLVSAVEMLIYDWNLTSSYSLFTDRYTLHTNIRLKNGEPLQIRNAVSRNSQHEPYIYRSMVAWWLRGPVGICSRLVSCSIIRKVLPPRHTCLCCVTRIIAVFSYEVQVLEHVYCTLFHTIQLRVCATFQYRVRKQNHSPLSLKRQEAPSVNVRGRFIRQRCVP